MVGAGIAVLGLVATLVLIRGSDSRAHVELGDRPASADARRRNRAELAAYASRASKKRA